MTNWRQPLPTRPCHNCSMPETGCEAGQMFGMAPCCVDCDHDDPKGGRGALPGRIGHRPPDPRSQKQIPAEATPKGAPMTTEKLSTLTAKLPKDLRDQFAALAKRRNLTPSRLLRSLVDRELAGRPDDVIGDVERAVSDELTDRGQDHDSARAAAALNMARRIDRDPTAGAANTAQLRALLAELAPAAASELEFSLLHWLRLSHQFRYRGWQVVDQAGNRFDLVSVDNAVRGMVFAEVNQGRPF